MISLPDALKVSEMGCLGDRMIGTEWPLVLMLYSDPTKPRRIGDDGTAPFTVGRVEYSVAGRVVSESAERSIVHSLMLYGRFCPDMVTVLELAAAQRPKPRYLHRGPLVRELETEGFDE